MDKRFLAEIIGLIVLVLILVVPGIYAVGILAHEMYHYISHTNYSEAFCVSVNSDAHAFVLVNSNDTLDKFDYYLEEKRANRFSAIVTWSYTLVFLCTIIWIMIIFAECKANRKMKKR